MGHIATRNTYLYNPPTRAGNRGGGEGGEMFNSVAAGGPLHLERGESFCGARWPGEFYLLGRTVWGLN